MKRCFFEHPVIAASRKALRKTSSSDSRVQANEPYHCTTVTMYTRLVKQHMLIRTAEPEGVWDPTLVEGKQARYQHLNDSTVATPELYKEATSRRQPPETHGSLLNGGNLRHHTFAETETMAQVLCEKPMLSKARKPFQRQIFSKDRHRKQEY